MEFNDLLQQAQRLANETHATDDMPVVERTFSQMLEATNELHSRVTRTGAQDLQAHILLGSKGIDLPKITQKLEEINARTTFAPLDPIDDTDIQSFLKNERENAILSVIEEVNKNTFKSAERSKWNHIMTEWNEEKTKLLNAFVGPSQNWIDIRNLPEQTVLDDNVTMHTSLNRYELAYAREVQEYNNKIIRGASRPNLVHIFSKLAQSFNDPKVDEIWEIVKVMVDVKPMSRNCDPIQSRQQSTQFICQAKKYLENRYKLYMSTIVNSNLLMAQRGGIPGVLSLVNSFVGLTFNEGNCLGMQDRTYDKKPLWPMVYLCLRCGDPSAALDCLKKNGATHDDDLMQALRDKINRPDQPLNTKLEAMLRIYYGNKIKNTTDPYKKAVYCIVAGCDKGEPHAAVNKTTDDFVWMQLSMLRAEDNPNSEELLTYSGLQTMILEKYGETYFNATDKRHLYFQVLALTGQFESAIEFLSRTEQYRVHAVHIALALNELFLIGGPRDVQAPLLTVDIEDPVPMRRLNIARLVMLYVKYFEIVNPGEALQYFYFLRNLEDANGRNLFLVCVSQLAVELRNYELLFGKVTPSGNVVGGLFEQFNNFIYDTRTVAAMVAEELVSKGSFEDAIILYNIAGNQTQALRYMSILLSQVVQQQTTPGSMRERLISMSDDFNSRLRSHQIEPEPHILVSFNLLNELAEFFDYYNNKKYQVALDLLAKTKLVPMSSNEIDECLQTFKRLTGEVTRVYPDVLLAAMNIIYAQYKSIKENRNSIDSSREHHLNQLREKAKTITNMAATVPYRMPGETNKRLVQTEILMN